MEYFEGTLAEAREKREAQGFFLEREEKKSSLRGDFFVRDYKCGCHSHQGSLVEGNWRFCSNHSFSDAVKAFGK